MKKENVIQVKSFEFAKGIILLCKKLKQHKEFEIAHQLIKSGTSIGANVEEALAGQSRRDFASKMSIAAKESRETRYWLLLLKETSAVDVNYQKYLDQAEEIRKILASIIKTTTKGF